MTTVSSILNLEEAVTEVLNCAQRMNTLYSGTVFNEWAIVSLLAKHEKVLFYEGTRGTEFAANFCRDIQELRTALLSDQYGFGDFEFARNADGTRIDAFMNVGEGLFLFCNNVDKDMEAITRNHRWLAAQRPFVELSETFRSTPLFYPA